MLKAAPLSMAIAPWCSTNNNLGQINRIYESLLLKKAGLNQITGLHLKLRFVMIHSMEDQS